MSKTLDKLLLPLDSHETYNYQVVQNKGLINPAKDIITFRIDKGDFFHKNFVFANKHHRFLTTPEHTHDFIELNYMYSGSCTQRINGENIQLKTNDVLLMDKNVTQEIGFLDVNDILINVLINLGPENANNYLTTNNVIMDFNPNVFYKKMPPQNYVIYNIAENEVALNLIQALIIKLFQKNSLNIEYLDSLLNVFLDELNQSTVRVKHYKEYCQDDIIEILNFINNNFQTTSLKEISKTFNYNQNYLSNKIKKDTGHTFRQLIEKKRFSEAKKLLRTSNDSIIEISQSLGYSNAASLFKLFEKFTDLTPNEYRKKELSKNSFLTDTPTMP